MARMRAAQIVSPCRIAVIEDGIPSCGRDMVMVRLLRAAICGSDLPYFSNSFDPKGYPLPPGYPGHECLGIVEESGNEQYRPGDHVMYYPVFLDGFKEYHITEVSRLQKIPSDGDFNILIMTQLLGAVSHCMFRIDKPYNKCVAVLGQGPVGLLFTSLLKIFGARKIIAVDPLEYRLAIAKKVGADAVVNPKMDDPAAAVSDLTGGRMVDIVIDAYGRDPEVLNQCFDLGARNGLVAFFGICLEENPPLRFGTFFRKEMRMICSVGPDLAIDYPFALDMIQRNIIDVKPLVTHTMPFDDIQRGFDIAAGRLDSVIKVILEF